MTPLIRMLDELREMTRSAGREDLDARLNMVRARISDPRVRLVVVGDPKNGMSTLVNGLVGAPVSATDAELSAPVIVEYGNEPSAAIVQAVGPGRSERKPVYPAHLRSIPTTKRAVRAARSGTICTHY